MTAALALVGCTLFALAVAALVGCILARRCPGCRSTRVVGAPLGTQTWWKCRDCGKAWTEQTGG